MKQPEWEPVFVALRGILKKHAGVLTVTSDAPGYYCLSIDFSPKLGKGFPVAWIKTGKRYVSFHLMPIYMFPKLKDGLSKRLRARMQGKSCFNFTIVDKEMFEELSQVTTKGLEMSKRAGFAPQGK